MLWTMNKYFTGKVVMGVVVPDSIFKQELKKYDQEKVLIEVEGPDTKTKAQLGYLFGHVFKEIGDYIGCEPYEVYQIMLERVPEITKYYRVIGGKTIEFTKHLSTMSKEETGKFIDAVLVYIRTSETLRHLEIKEPDPLWKE